jgi:hypothetical protein
MPPRDSASSPEVTRCSSERRVWVPGERDRAPTRAKLSSKDDAVADTKPHVKPMRVRSVKVEQAEPQANCERYTLNEGYSDKVQRCVLAAH